MKMKATIVEVEGEGLVGLIGERILLFCVNYIYTGILEGVNETSIKLSDAKIVYETGEFSASTFKDVQRLPSDDWYIGITAIESYGVVNK